ncbi:MAG TPA: hypothetical protein VGH30_12180 [Jatrophihabitantaceae bacterium]
MRVRWTRIRTVAVLSVLVASASLAAPARGADAAKPSTTIDAAVHRAEKYARARGVNAAIAVLDRHTGAFYSAGNVNHFYGAASVMKVFVAARLLDSGQMHGRVNRLAYRMITRSDNRAVEKLLPLVGGTRVVRWAAKRYRIHHLGSPPNPGKEWCWGNTHVSARGLVTFYTRVLKDAHAAHWLSRAMHNYRVRDADGLDQIFGIPAATTGAGVKQGEGHCSDDTNGSIINSTGLLQNNRYSMAILTESHICCRKHGFNRRQARIVTHMARVLLPGGIVDLPVHHNPHGHVSGATKGSTATVHGWAFDPDLADSPVQVRIVEAGRVLWHGPASAVNKRVDRRHRLTGNHGFAAPVPLANGAHRLCAVFVNSGMGDANTRRCTTVHVQGRPDGKLASITAQSATITVSGWAYDRDVTPAASTVTVALDGVAQIVTADRSRPAGTYPVHGAHGFDVTLHADAGKHRVCVTANDVGPVSNRPRQLGCRSVIVSR